MCVLQHIKDKQIKTEECFLFIKCHVRCIYIFIYFIKIKFQFFYENLTIRAMI